VGGLSRKITVFFYTRVIFLSVIVPFSYRYRSHSLRLKRFFSLLPAPVTSFLMRPASSRRFIAPSSSILLILALVASGSSAKSDGG
jgi:hypothetical protein